MRVIRLRKRKKDKTKLKRMNDRLEQTCSKMRFTERNEHFDNNTTKFRKCTDHHCNCNEQAMNCLFEGENKIRFIEPLLGELEG